MMFPPLSHRNDDPVLSLDRPSSSDGSSGGNVTVKYLPPTVKGAPFRNPGLYSASESIMQSKLPVISFGAPASDLHTGSKDGM